MKRFGMSGNASKKNFTRNAGAHPRNFSPNPMRGGYRL